jgi:hypothetical protein
MQPTNAQLRTYTACFTLFACVDSGELRFGGLAVPSRADSDGEWEAETEDGRATKVQEQMLKEGV